LRSIVFEFTKPKYALSKAFGKVAPSLYYGAPSPLKLVEIEEPSLRGDDWLKVSPTYSGICGSDLGVVLGKTSPALSPFNSFPMYLGHEILGVVTEVGKSVTNVQVGDRVAIDPYISCVVRGRDELCESCRRGNQALCRYKGGDENFGPGMILGYNNELIGGWSESIVIHESMVIPVPDFISDYVAAMIEPLSVGLHGVLRKTPQTDDRVLVIGGGTIAYTIIAALKLLNVDCEITHLSRYSHQQAMGAELGVDHAFVRREDVEKHMLTFNETRKHKPILGKEVYSGGFDVVYDCVGSQQSIDNALRMTRAGEHFVLVGGAGQIFLLDWSFVWANELSIIGTHGYSLKEKWQGKEMTTQEILFHLIEQQPNYPLEKLVTHEFALEEYKEAIIANINSKQYKSIKTLFKIN